MIARLWRGWTTAKNAPAYEGLLRSTILPGLHRVAGYRGAWLLRRTGSDGVEFATVTLWESMAAVREFAGDDPDVAVVPPEARRLLQQFDQRSVHYEVVEGPS
jgi:heme-degrading monooxygenase HmoA